jgi:hypothetical protein
MPKQINTSEFIKRAKKVHGDKFDYSEVLYTNMTTKVKIIDSEFGEFYQTPIGHLQGQGHPSRRYIKSSAKKRKGKDEFIRQAIELHGNLYDYSKVVYEHCDKKVCIVDPEFGEFLQSPYQHLRSHGCPERTKNKKWIEHVDHIIPLSILCTGNKTYNKWFMERPLYKFLNSDINLHKVNARFNRDKSDFVTINDKQVNASSVRNNYKIIGYLIKSLLKIDPAIIIAEDEKYINDYFGI